MNPRLVQKGTRVLLVRTCKASSCRNCVLHVTRWVTAEVTKYEPMPWLRRLSLTATARNCHFIPARVVRCSRPHSIATSSSFAQTVKQVMVGVISSSQSLVGRPGGMRSRADIDCESERSPRVTISNRREKCLPVDDVPAWTCPAAVAIPHPLRSVTKSSVDALERGEMRFRSVHGAELDRLGTFAAFKFDLGLGKSHLLPGAERRTGSSGIEGGKVRWVGSLQAAFCAWSICWSSVERWRSKVFTLVRQKEPLCPVLLPHTRGLKSARCSP